MIKEYLNGPQKPHRRGKSESIGEVVKELFAGVGGDA
jgi:hypothetical protein